MCIRDSLDTDGDGFITTDELIAARPPRGDRGPRGADDDAGAPR